MVKTTNANPPRTRRRLGAALSVAAIVGGLVAAGTAANAQTDGVLAATQTSPAQDSASVASNKRLVLEFLHDVLNGHHGDHAASYFTRNMTFHAGTVGTFTGRDTVAAVLGSVVTAIPDLHASLQDIIAQDNDVVVRLVVSGTQEGPLLGIPATGRHVQWDAVDVYRLHDGKIAEEWASEDLTAILHDTGTYTAPWIQ